MSASIHLAGPSDLAVLLPMVAAFHAETGFDSDEARRQAAVEPLLEGSPLGCVYLIGPRRAPVGYVAITFGWSLAEGGMDGHVDDFFVRPGVRGRGVGGEALRAILPQLEEAGLVALRLAAAADDTRLQRFYARAGFTLRDDLRVMTRTARRVRG